MESDNAKLRDVASKIAGIFDSDVAALEGHAKFLMETGGYGGGIIEFVVGCIKEARAALAAPPRNCDVGTAEEQAKRYCDYCDKRLCSECPCCGKVLYGKCEFAWAQMPYNEGGAK